MAIIEGHRVCGGNETTYFPAKVRVALWRYCEKYGISRAKAIQVFVIDALIEAGLLTEGEIKK